MATTTIHYFTAGGTETTEGAEDSVVQYDEATAEKLGYTFKAAKDEPTPDPAEVRAENLRIAALDGTEAPASPVTVPKTEPEAAPEETPAPKKRAAKK